MSVFRKSIGVMARRPFVLILPAVLILIYDLINLYNPLTALVNLFTITNTDFFEVAVSLLKYVFEPQIFFLGMALIIGILLGISLLLSLIISGYLYVFHNSYLGKQGFRGEFWNGVSKYYYQVVVVTSTLLVSIFLLIIFVFVASVPSIVITRSWLSGEEQLLPAVIFVNILSMLVLTFIVVLYRSYTALWYPSVYCTAANWFKTALSAVNSGLYKVSWRLALFDVVSLILIYLNSYFKNITQNFSNANIFMIPSLFLINWIVKTYMVIFFISMVFCIFYNLSAKKKPTACGI